VKNNIEKVNKVIEKKHPQIRIIKAKDENKKEP